MMNSAKAKDDRDSIFKDLRIYVNIMNGRLALNEETLKQKQVELKETKEELKEALERFKIKKNSLTFVINDLTHKCQDLERDVSIMRNPPFIHPCGFNGGVSTSQMTIPYTSLLYFSTNTEGGGLDKLWYYNYFVFFSTLSMQQI